jgi:hypothetical protein
LSDIRPISNEKRFGNKENNTKNKAIKENESNRFENNHSI